MRELRPRLRVPERRVAVIVSRYNEAVSLRLLDGALRCFHERGVPGERIDVVWVPGTAELPAAAARAAVAERYAAIVALGVVIRGETPHFEYVALGATYGLQQVAVAHRIPVAFGVLTTEDLHQAVARAGGVHGNKGFDAAMAALDLADVLAQLDAPPA